MTVPFCQNAPDIENRADGLGAGDASPTIRIGRKHTNINPINYCRTKATGLDLGSVVGVATASKSRVQYHAIGNSANRRSRSVGRARRASSWRTIVDRPLSSIWQSQQAVIHGLGGLWGKVKEGQCIEEEEKRSVAHARHASMPHCSRFPPGKLCRRPLFAIAASACSSLMDASD